MGDCEVAENKTRPTDADVEAFLAGVENATRRGDGFAVLELMRRVTGVEPVMWGPAIVGFGSYHYRYESGREGDAPRIGFSPRKANLVLYLFSEGREYGEFLSRLGKHKTGVACLYINKLADVDMEVLEALIAHSWAETFELYPETA